MQLLRDACDVSTDEWRARYSAVKNAQAGCIFGLHQAMKNCRNRKTEAPSGHSSFSGQHNCHDGNDLVMM